MNGIYIFIMICTILLFAFLFITYTKKDVVHNEPIIKFKKTEIILKPENQGTTSGYATGKVVTENVDINVVWENSGGFSLNKVDSIIVRRFIGSREISGEKRLTEDRYISDFGGGEVTFKGSELNPGETGVGDNVIKLFYTKNGDTQEYLLGTTNTITITQNHLDMILDLKSFRTFDVPQDCQGYWSGWGSCSRSCDGGVQYRTWTTTSPPKHGGAACPSPTTQGQSCNTQPCPVNCQGYWTGWGSCSKPCGWGTQNNYWVTTVQPQYGGSGCPSPTTQTQYCNTHACPAPPPSSSSGTYQSG